MEQENASLKDQVKTLQQEIIGLKANAEKTASQFERDIAAAKSQVKKAEQARMDAEAKIKTLEKENADLRKKGPLGFLKK